MKKYILLTIAILSLAFAGCNSATKEDHSAQQNNNASNAAVKPAEEPAKTETAATADSPTAVFTSFVEAMKKKDAATMKNSLSKASLVQMEEAAKMQKKTLDEILADTEDVAKEKTPAVQNEKIDGDTATVEVENEITKKWDTVPFVKEDGKWKIAMDKIKN